MPTHVTESTGASITAEWEFTTGTCTVSPTASFTADVIGETTASTGVTIDGVKCKDSGVSVPLKIYADTIEEYTAAAGVTADGVKCKDGGVSTTANSTLNGAAVSGAFSLTSDQVQVTEGGTGFATAATGGLIYGQGTSAFGVTAAGVSGSMIRYNASNVPIINHLLEHVVFVVTAPSTSVSVVSDAAQFFFPFAGYIQTAFAGVSTAATGTSLTTVDVWINTSSIFSTKLTIDASETTSSTAATPAVIATATSAFSQWDWGRVHVDLESAVPGKGLVVELICVRLS